MCKWPDLNRLRQFGIVAGLVVAVSCLGGCDRLSKISTTASADAAQTQPSVQEEVVVPIQAALPKRGDISSHFETTTRVDAENRVLVMAEAMERSPRFPRIALVHVQPAAERHCLTCRYDQGPSGLPDPAGTVFAGEPETRRLIR